MYDLGPLQRRVDVRADVFNANVFLKLRLLHELGGLRSRAAKDQRAARGVETIGEIFEGKHGVEII